MEQLIKPLPEWASQFLKLSNVHWFKKLQFLVHSLHLLSDLLAGWSVTLEPDISPVGHNMLVDVADVTENLKNLNYCSWNSIMYFEVLFSRHPVHWNIVLGTPCTLKYYSWDTPYLKELFLSQRVPWSIVPESTCTLKYFSWDTPYFEVFSRHLVPWIILLETSSAFKYRP